MGRTKGEEVRVEAIGGGREGRGWEGREQLQGEIIRVLALKSLLRMSSLELCVMHACVIFPQSFASPSNLHHRQESDLHQLYTAEQA